MIPWLWGDGMLSYSSVILSGVGACVGLWVGLQNLDLKAQFTKVWRALTWPQPNPRFRPLLLKT